MSELDRTARGAGTRLPWRAMPLAVRAWVEEMLESRVVDVADEAGGFSPGPACRVRTEDGRRAFVKAVGAEVNPVSPGMHRREAAVTAQLPRSQLLPRLLATYDDGGWVALLFEEVDGRPPALPWRRDELRRVGDALTQLHAALTPNPITDLEPVGERFRDDLRGWQSLAATNPMPSTVDEWCRRNVGRLAELESSWEAAARGTTLLHCDVRADNVLLANDDVVFVDWAHAAVGAPAFDVVAWAPSVALQGGPPPDELVAAHAATTAVAHDALDALVAAIAGYFTYQATLPPAGLPSVRRFQAAQAEVARAWLRRRTGWP